MAQRNAIPRICFDRVIPDSFDSARSMIHRAALANYVSVVHAQAANLRDLPPRGASFLQSAHAIHGLAELNASHPVIIARMAVINVKKWDNGYTLRCRFLDGDSFQQKKVQEKAEEWTEYANLKISFGTDPDAEIRISFHADAGSWSAIGNDCLVTSYFPKYQPTMNFGWLRDDTSDTEYRRVVVHEFGHALGCIHEHQSPNENLQWNTKAVYAAFSGPPNYWSKADIDHNILQKYSPAGISATQFDEKSIMLYQFDASLFKNHKPTPENTDLSEKDKQMIGQMYLKQSAKGKAAGSGR